MKKILMQGNVALCEGAIAAGLDAYFGYPITPQNEVAVHMSRRMRELNRVFIQAESEIAAINMVFGVSITGKRAMTSSSSPGISLKQEGISYLCGCELPGVIANIQRGGPGLGNISGSQGDYFQAVKGGGHGDYRMITLAPASVQEGYDFAYLSFDLTEKYHNPVLILMDGYTGQMMEPVQRTDRPPIPAKKYKKDWVLDGCKGREPRKIRSLLMNEGELEELNWKLKKKYDKITDTEIRVETINTNSVKKLDVILIAFGVASRVCKGAMNIAREKGKKVGLIRPLTLWPFPYKTIEKLAKKTKKILVVEMNLGQMVEDVKIAVGDKCKVEFLGRPGGSIVNQDEIFSKIK